MTRVVEVPPSSTTAASTSSPPGSASWPPEEKLLVDARAAQWASPYGLIGMLTAGQALAEANGTSARCSPCRRATT